MTPRTWFPLAVGLAFSTLAAAAPAPRSAKPAAPALDKTLFQALEWRSIGPYRGGRVTAVSGVTSEPSTFYFGATGGGIWKTTDAGARWTNLSDGQLGTGSVGALAVALGAGLVYSFRRRPAPARVPEESRKDLLLAIASLDDDFEASKVPEARYRRLRAELMARLLGSG